MFYVDEVWGTFLELYKRKKINEFELSWFKVVCCVVDSFD